MKKLISIMIIISMFSTCYAEGEIKEPQINAQSAILVDFKTGRVLWEKDPHKMMPMASTTKIMTALVTLENCDLKEVVTVSSRAANAPKVKMFLSTGEQQRIEDLLYALMLQSSNDAAVAIAEHIGGSVENFCDMMTEKSRELGALNTSFKTPNGLDAEDHYSTAYDLAVITRYALNNEKFMEIINTHYVNTPISGGDFKSYYVENKNRLLTEYDGAIGVKTGFTGGAGHSFVGAAKRDDMELISVVLASGWGDLGREQKWVDTKRILNYGFENYKNYTVVEKGAAVSECNVSYSKEGIVKLATKNEVVLPLREDELNKLKYNKAAYNELESPVKSGQYAGYISVNLDGKNIAKVELLTMNDIARHDFAESIKKVIKTWYNVSIKETQSVSAR